MVEADWWLMSWKLCTAIAVYLPTSFKALTTGDQ